MSELNVTEIARNIPTAAKVNPVVKVQEGNLIGFRRGKTNCFFGIPYTKANRFELPQKADHWDGYRYAQSYGVICPIPKDEAVGGNEFLWQHRFWIQNEKECHNLNIWTPTLDTASKKPVIVFYHGGGYKNGSAIEAYAYDGQNLSEKGQVVVVTVNHRLNTLAFLDLSSFGEKYRGSANNEAHDILASLQWIHDNISQFGGNPDNVTIFGQSAGGQDIESMLRCPDAKGLFRAAGIISGHNPTIQSGADSRKVGELTTEILGLAAENIDQIQDMDYLTVYNASQEACSRLRKTGSTYWLSPCADGFIQADFCDFVKDIPIFSGGDFSEFRPCFAFGDQRHSEWSDDETRSWLLSEFGSEEKVQKLLDSYHILFPGKPDYALYFFGYQFRAIGEAVDNILSDIGAKVYSYVFAYESPVNGSTLPFHCYELYWFFNNVDTIEGRDSCGTDPRGLEIQNEITDALINFMYTGSMSTANLPWDLYNRQEKKIMIFDNNCSECRSWTELDNFLKIVSEN